MDVIRAGAHGRRAVAALAALVVATTMVRAAPPQASSSPASDGPFERASIVPGDVDTYVHVEGAAELRAELGSRPILAGAWRLFAGNATHDVWMRLAARTGLEPETLFRRLLGRSTTVIARGDAWAIVTEVTPGAGAGLVEALRPKRLAPYRDVRLLELVEQDVLIAQIGADEWIVAPRGARRLVLDVVDLRTGHARATPLAEQERLVAARARFAQDLGNARLGCYVEHDDLVGGASVAVGDLAGDRLRVRHHATFVHPPFARSITDTHWDASALDALERRFMVTVAEPTALGPSTLDMFIESRIGPTFDHPATAGNVGASRIVGLGAIDGRREDPPRDGVERAGFIAVEVKEPAEAEAQLDAMLERVILEGERHPGVHFVRDERWAPGAPRGVNVRLDPDAEDVIGLRDPLLPVHHLCWTVAANGDRAWYVVATHPTTLRDATQALTQPAPARRTGAWEVVSSIDGVHLGQHLFAMAARAEDFGQGLDDVDEGSIEDFRASMRALAEFASGVTRCRLRLDRPTETTMDLEIELQLAAPESAESAPASRRDCRRDRVEDP